MIGSRSDRDRFDAFQTVFTDLRDEAASDGAVILVEGEKDRRALRRLGLSSPIALVHQGQRLPSLTHDLATRHRRAVVLTDWDRKGGQLAERITTLLEGADLRVDREVRQRLARVLRGELVHVEGLYRWASRLAEAVGTTLGAALDDGNG